MTSPLLAVVADGGLAAKRTTVKGGRRGFQMCLSKPIEPAELAVVLASLRYRDARMFSDQRNLRATKSAGEADE